MTKLIEESKDIEVLLQQELIKRELARRNFKDYISYVKPDFIFSKFHLDMIEKLQLVAEGKITRLILNLPPGHGKTLLVALWSSWCLGRDQEEEFVNVGYSSDISRKTSRLVRSFVFSIEFKNLFPNFQISKSKNSDSEWETTGGKTVGGYFATGVGGPLTGKRYTKGLIDDPVKNRQQAESTVWQDIVNSWFTSVFSTRGHLIKQNVAVVIILTRWSTNDLIGFIEELEAKGGEKYERVIYQAINDETGEVLWPEQLTKADYEMKRIELGERDFQALYQQNPIKSMGNIFKREYFKYFKLSDFDNGTYNRQDFLFGVFIDPATSTQKDSDDVVAMIAGIHKYNRDIYVLDITGGIQSPSEFRYEFFNMLYRAEEINNLNINFISIEQIAINKSQTQFKVDLVEEMRTRLIKIPIYSYIPREEKLTRIKYTLEPSFQQGRIYTLNKQDINYNKLYKKLEEQLLSYPHMRHDDYPDCLTQAVTVLEQKLSGEKTKKKWEEKEIKQRFNPISRQIEKINKINTMTFSIGR